MSEALFLTLDDVLGIHSDQIRRYGGSPGLRALGLLQSALGMPETTFDGEFLHGTPFEMGPRISSMPRATIHSRMATSEPRSCARSCSSG